MSMLASPRNPRDLHTLSDVNAAAVVTIPGAANRRIRLLFVVASLNAGGAWLNATDTQAAPVQHLNVWVQGAAPTTVLPAMELSIPAGAGLVLTLATGGSGNRGAVTANWIYE